MSKSHPESVDTGLLALIVAGDNSAEAARLLKAAETPIPERTLRHWRHVHGDRYLELQTEHAPRVAERLAAKGEALATRLGDLEDKLIDRVADQVGDLKPAEAAAALRNVTTSKALQLDKVSSPLRGRPSQVIQHIDPRETMLAMYRELAIPIEGTAVEEMAVPALESGAPMCDREEVQP